MSRHQLRMRSAGGQTSLGMLLRCDHAGPTLSLTGAGTPLLSLSSGPDCLGPIRVWESGCVHEHMHRHELCTRHLQRYAQQHERCPNCATQAQAALIGPNDYAVVTGHYCELVLVERALAHDAIEAAGGPWHPLP